MRAFFRIAAMMTALLVAGCGAAVPPEYRQEARFAAAADNPQEYRIGPGDDLSVVLPYNPELNYEGPVGPDGRFTMPVAGAIGAAGQTVAEAEAAIGKALAERRIVAAAQPSITIRHYAQVIYVGGEVKQPGSIPLQNRMDPLQAISVAGGLLDTARSEEIVIIRRGADGQPILRTLDLKSYLQSGDITQAPLISRGGSN